MLRHAPDPPAQGHLAPGVPLEEPPARQIIDQTVCGALGEPGLAGQLPGRQVLLHLHDAEYAHDAVEDSFA
ncbi:hypothetical protein [Nesterenkonia pannonica]|uniref:hypothetical protein n=1 Tax=Nesterenkonia pannonica TaxID=1548602 RepID=UPI002164E136|nr:hypothetical protein [Nesterenkonia pannonica]